MLARDPATPRRSAVRTKIVATIGPASDSADVMDALLDGGVSVARINLAHGDRDWAAMVLERVRDRAAARSHPLAVLADLAGPKLRMGSLRGGRIDLVQGGSFTLTADAIEGDARRAGIDHAGLAQHVHAGDRIFLADGSIRLVVHDVHGRDVHTIVEAGGSLAQRQGVSVPGADLDLPALTAKDLADLDFVAAARIDYAGLSFVHSAADVEQLRAELRNRGSSARIVAKIETRGAIERLDEIVRAADAVMVARGDLGVQFPIEEVPVLQKRIIALCNRWAVPVITATQMLESMITHPYPTRAEASDVANAVIDGTDAAMLSGETSIGRYPVETVAVMRRILERAEKMGGREPQAIGKDARADASMADAIARSACLVADALDACALVCLTQTGSTARYLSKWRSPRPIIGVTPEIPTWHRLALGWGVEPVLVAGFPDNFDRACEEVLERLRRAAVVTGGRPVVFTAGMPFERHGRTNVIRVEMA